MSVENGPVYTWTDPYVLCFDRDYSWVWTVESADWSGTWTAKVRDIGPEGTNQSLTLTVTDSYSTDTTLTVAMTASQWEALVASGEREWRGWFAMSRSEAPGYGLQGPVIFRLSGNT